MWNRKELKRKGKAAFKANYWRCVLVALLIVFVLGSSATAVRTGADRGLDSGSEAAQLDTDYNQLDTLLEQVPSEKMPLVIAVVVGVFLVALVVFVLVDALLFNPLEVGCRRFFLVNTEGPASLKELVFGYENRYGNVVQTILLRDIYLFLWSLLFIFPIVVTLVVALLVPSAGALVGMLMFGNILKESGVCDRLVDTAQNALMNIVTIFLGISVGATTTAGNVLNLDFAKVMILGVVAFSLGTCCGLFLAKIMNWVTGGKINPLIGSAGVSAVPMAARISQKVGAQTDPTNFLLMHAMGPNVAGVIGSAVAAGVLLSVIAY